MNVMQDFRFAWRSLRSRFGTTAFATLTLATGMAAAIAISCVIDAVMLRSLPYPAADAIVQMSEVAADGQATMAFAQPNYDDLVASLDALSASAFHYSWPGTIQSGDATIRATIDTSGGDFFGVLGVAPQLGRTFGKDEREKVAVIADGLWRGLLGTRADVIGSRIDLNGERYTIIGVMPSTFAFPAGAVAWSPSLDPPYTSRTAHNFEAIGRLQYAERSRPRANCREHACAKSQDAPRRRHRCGRVRPDAAPRCDCCAGAECVAAARQPAPRFCC